MNLAGAVSVFATPIPVTRPGMVQRMRGNVIGTGQPTTFMASGSFTPFSPREQLLLPEAERTKEYWRYIGTTPLQTVNVQAQTPSDRITWQGKTFEVMKVNDWSAQGFYDCECRKVGQ